MTHTSIQIWSLVEINEVLGGLRPGRWERATITHTGLLWFWNYPARDNGWSCWLAIEEIA